MSWPTSEHAQSSPRAIPSNTAKTNEELAKSFPLTESYLNPTSQSQSDSIADSAQEALNKQAVISPAADASETEDIDGNAAASKISAYARLDFENYTFFVQTLQVVLGRNSNEEIQSSQHSVDVHLGSKKAISRRHAKIFYNFGTQRFEISIVGRNGAFIDDLFVEKGITLPLADGTKVQIGDIPFTFVLPTIEPSEENEKKQKPGQLINPSDAINLRTNLYQSSTSPQREKKKKVQILMEMKKDIARRNSKADIVRRLSTARRKSNATTNDEINALLKELEELEGENGEEFDPDSLDEEVRELLAQQNSKNLTEEQLEKEEVEIDELVKQHNLQQGVNLDEPETAQAKKHTTSVTKPDVDIDIHMLDQEIATLAPLIDAHNEVLGKDKEGELKELEERKKFLAANGYSLQSKYSFPNASNASFYDTNTELPLRTAPLMGKPASGPRMGKPATIQPPANRVYGRQPTTMGQTNSPYPSAYPLNASPYSTYNSYIGGANTSLYNPMLTRPPPPKLEVLVETITRIPTISSIVPFKAITSTFDSFEKAPICVFKSLDPPSAVPKIPIRRKDGLPRKPPRVQSFKEVPDQFKSKPSINILAMVTAVLKRNDKKGYTLGEIHEGIKELFPYYKFCPDGWQSMVTHNVRFNQIFKKVSSTGPESEWLWQIDEEYILEKEKVRKRQQELAVSKAKEAALKAVELRQRQRLDVPQYNALGRTYMNGETAYGSRYSSPTPTSNYSLQRPKSIAELASEIKRDGTYSSGKSPTYFHGQSSLYNSTILTPEPERPSGTTIKDQLAANRARASVSPSPNPVSQLGSPPPTSLPAMNADTKKSLTYLQKELFTLYKARKLSYNTAVTTEIITKALATTIAQVNIIGSKAGCGDNALSFLVEKAPQQVSKILDIALTKSIKEKQAATSKLPSLDQSPQSTPGPSTQRTGETKIDSSSTNTESTKMKDTSGLSKPPSFSPGLSRPTFSGKPLGLAKPGALAKPPQFISNKPKRPIEDADEPKKMPRYGD